jgi:hypothetical protein
MAHSPTNPLDMVELGRKGGSVGKGNAQLAKRAQDEDWRAAHVTLSLWRRAQTRALRWLSCLTC